MPLKLIIANKAYSSWSLRPWILLAHFHIPFEEVVIPMDQPETRARMLEYAPDRQMPVVARRRRSRSGNCWRSSNMSPRQYPEKAIWPRGEGRRGRMPARSPARCTPGFQALRQHCPTQFLRPVRKIALTPEVEADVRGSRRPGRGRARDSARRARSCSASSARRTRCSRRWSTGCTSTTSRSRRRRAPIWMRSWRCRHGKLGSPTPRPNRGGIEKYDVDLKKWLSSARPAPPARKRRAPRVRSIGDRRIIAEGLEHNFWTDFYHNAMTVSWPAFFASLAAAFVALTPPSRSST